MKTEPDRKTTKSRLRADLRQRRAGLDAAERKSLDKAINAHLLAQVRRRGFESLAAYLSFDGEPDLRPALEQLAREGVLLALPVVHEVPGRDFITFRRWEPGDDLAPNRFGILEPTGAAELPLPTLDLVLVPLVGWNRAGARLGMGASFYDRLFQPYAQQARPLRTGVGYGVQEAGEIPLDPWDIRLQAMLTDTGWFTCGS